MANIKSFPNNQDTYVGAEYVMRWLHGRTSGVFAADGNARVTAASGELAVEINDGCGWISNDKGDGTAWWIDALEETGLKLKEPVSLPDAVLDRIDRVVITWETTDYVALPTVTVLKGTPSSKPVPPTLTNNSTKRQISLAQIKLTAGATSITPDMIIDERLDKSVCGLVTESAEVDTSAMQAQFDEFMKTLETSLSGDVAGNLLNLINHKVDKVDGETLTPVKFTHEYQNTVDDMSRDFNLLTQQAKGIVFSRTDPTTKKGNYVYLIAEE